MLEQPEHCPVCTCTNIGYEFRAGIRRLFRCGDCDLLFVPQSVKGQEQSIAVESQVKSSESQGPVVVGHLAEASLARLQSRGSIDGIRYCVAGKGRDQFVDCARADGLELVDTTPELFEGDLVDAYVLFGVLGEVAHPLVQLSSVGKVLKPAGLLLLTVPTVDSVQARRHKSQWTEFESQRITFFSQHGLSALLVRAGYDNIMTWPEPNGLTVLCRKKADEKDCPRLSIVLPVYNERATFEQLIETVLEKTFDTMEREVRVWGYPHLLDAFLPTNRFGQFRDVQAPNKLTGRFRYYFNLHSLQRPCPRPDPDQQRVTEKGGFHLPQWGPQCLVAPWSDLFCAPLEAAGAQGHRGGYRPDRGPGRDFGEETAR